MYLFQTAKLIKILNAGRFILHILFNIIWIQLCRIFFNLTVLRSRFRMGAQILSEYDVPSQFSGIFWTYIQMVFFQMWHSFVSESFSIYDSQIAFVDITDRRKPFYYQR